MLPSGYVEDVTFRFLSNARNTRRRVARIVYSSEEDVEVPPEPNPVTSAKWAPEKPLVVKYVMDVPFTSLIMRRPWIWGPGE